MPIYDNDMWLLVLNPVSGGGRGVHHRQKIERALSTHGLRHVTAVSDYPGHTTQLTIDAIAAGCRRIIVAGGDGSLGEAANGILAQQTVPTAAVTLATLPVGTGNDWARSHHIPHDYDEAAALLAGRQGQPHDAGLVEFPRTGERRYFVNVAGIGFDATVVQRMPSRRLGRLAYLVGLLRGIAAYHPLPLRLRVAGKCEEASALVLLACINRYFGGGMLVAPEAQCDDGLLDLVLIRHMGALEILHDLPRLFDGSLATHPKVSAWTVAEGQIEGPEGAPLEADGEFVGYAPAIFRVLPGALSMVRGR
jgi:YegS/Rv2252/BmrU family lipid kinase